MPHHSGAELPGAQALRQMAAQSDSRGLFSDRAPDPAYAGLFLNRELSWLAFDRRVLAEAADETLPVYERLKFLSIYCSNLDEFYMVRVGGLLDRALLQPWHTENTTGLTPREQLRAIYDETARQQKDFAALWRKVTAALAKQHVEILDFDRLDEADEVLLRRRFDALRPLLSPQVLDAEHPLPFLRNREQYVLVRFAGKRGGAGLVPTTQLPKFFRLTVDGVQKLALTAPLVAHFAPLLFGERRVRETAIVRVTRNADISVRDIMDGCDADLRAVEAVITDALPAMYEENRGVFLDMPQYIGVEELAGSGVVLKFIVSATEENIFAARRALITDRALEPRASDPHCGGTIYLCTADREGNMVSFIQSNYTTFGAGVAVPVRENSGFSLPGT